MCRFPQKKTLDIFPLGGFDVYFVIDIGKSDESKIHSIRNGMEYNFVYTLHAIKQFHYGYYNINNLDSSRACFSAELS